MAHNQNGITGPASYATASGELPAGYDDGDPYDDAPPHDPAAESALISACIIKPNLVPRVAEVLTSPRPFYSRANGTRWSALVALHEKGVPIDAVTIGAWLRERGRLADAGGMAELVELLNAAPSVSPAAVLAYAAQVAADAQRRDLIEATDLASSMLRLRQLTPTEAQAKLTNDCARIVTTVEGSPAILYGADLAQPIPPRPWLCESAGIVNGPPTFIGAAPDSGKSLITGDLIIATTLGAAFLGRFPCRKGRAIAIDWDRQGKDIWRSRLMRQARAHGTELATIGRDIAFLDAPRFYLDETAGIAELARIVDGFDLAVLDSFGAMAPGLDEWKRGPVRKLIDALTDISVKSGCVIVVIDHTVKPSRDPKSARAPAHNVHGSTAKLEGLQAIFNITGEPGDPTRRIIPGKNRARGVPLAPFDVAFTDIARGDDPRWGLRVAVVERDGTAPATPEEQARAAVLRVLGRRHDLASVGALRTVVGMSMNLVSDALRALQAGDRPIVVKLDGFYRLASEVT